MLETKRLILRNWVDEDAERLYELAKDPQVGPAAGWEPHQSVEESLETIRTVFHSDTIYAIILKSTGELIGCIGFCYDENLCKSEKETLLGYWLGTDYWNHGYITEATQECIRHAFEDLDIQTIWCGNFSENKRSARVQEKCGFIYHHTENSDNYSGEMKTVIINFKQPQ